MKDPRRWLLLASIAVVGAAWMLAPGAHTRSGDGQRCLVHDDCAKGLRCYAEPKDDGFATHGVCVETCLDDEQCRPGHRCGMTAEGSAQLVPVAPGRSPGERVCLKEAGR